MRYKKDVLSEIEREKEIDDLVFEQTKKSLKAYIDRKKLLNLLF